MEILYQRRHPDHPWLTKSANSILSSYLKDSDIGLEFGSGRSTLWFAQRVSALTSVEHDPLWYSKVSEMLKGNGISNVTQLLFEKDQDMCVNQAYLDPLTYTWSTYAWRPRLFMK